MRALLSPFKHNKDSVKNGHQRENPTTTGIVNTTTSSPSSLPLDTINDTKEAVQVERFKETMQKEIDELQKEIMVRSEVAVQLAEKVITLRCQLQRREVELNTLKRTGTTDLETTMAVHTGNDISDSPSGKASTGSTHSAGEEKNGNYDRRDSNITGPSEVMESHVNNHNNNSHSSNNNNNNHSNNLELSERLVEMETQVGVWKQRVKEALKSSQGRERSLLAENIALNKKLQELQGKLNEAAFQMEASALRSARHGLKINSTSQTEVTIHPSDNDNDDDDDNNNNNSENNDDNDINIKTKSNSISNRSSYNNRKRYYQSHSIPIISPARVDSTESKQTMESTLEMSSSGGLLTSPPLFPYPLQPFQGNHQNLFSPVEVSSCDPAIRTVVPPFIVAVHYNNDNGWSVQTKVRVEPGMTVIQLKEYCCVQFQERHQLQLDHNKLCVRYYHERAKRHVVLSPYRELHSFAHFQHCEREKLPIVLFLIPEDNLSKLVYDTMNNTKISPIVTPHNQNE
ncbi:uncharacterized protein TM35_000201330 [Trypanosoma theileri]|uniref:Uncharacterized protein n=1 Tax=Trypanosoma theileri TaxID=67003 RepID=A0A1X0NSP9_9TRYP|nr:uncharacterized protein TM35_000201330 [Trypanosoma theileri]ORC87724.1 hypothetical protein TM35_000201330 [Trypanosoma theileri]